jgi:hypothetical protein
VSSIFHIVFLEGSRRSRRRPARWTGTARTAQGRAARRGKREPLRRSTIPVGLWSDGGFGGIPDGSPAGEFGACSVLRISIRSMGHLKPGFHSHSFLSAVIGLDARWGPELKAGAAHSAAAFTLQAKPNIAVTRTRSVLPFHFKGYKESIRL